MTIVEISGKRYVVKILDGICQTLVDDKWMNSSEFIDHLKETNQIDTILELAKLGFRIKNER